MTSQAENRIQIRIRTIPRLIRDLIKFPLNRDYRIHPPMDFSPDDFTQDFLGPEEHQRLNRFKALKKQVEWLCGRFCAKSAAKEQLMPDHGLDKISIQYLDQGAPYLTAFPDHCLSLSHSGIYTATALSMAPGILTGIDVEAVAPRPDPHFMKTAFTPREIRQLGSSGHAVFQAWTLKEAYLKYIRLGFNESLHQVEVINNEIYHHREKQGLDCRSWELDKGYILSAVFPKGTVIDFSPPNSRANRGQIYIPRIFGS